jgi:hypothetical protein
MGESQKSYLMLFTHNTSLHTEIFTLKEFVTRYSIRDQQFFLPFRRAVRLLSKVLRQTVPSQTRCSSAHCWGNDEHILNVAFILAESPSDSPPRL